MKEVHEFDYLRERNWVGFADVYLDQCSKESDSGVKADRAIYTELTELDARLGTTTSEQLLMCLWRTTRSDIIKVRIYVLNVDLNRF